MLHVDSNRKADLKSSVLRISAPPLTSTHPYRIAEYGFFGTDESGSVNPRIFGKLVDPVKAVSGLHRGQRHSSQI